MDHNNAKKMIVSCFKILSTKNCWSFLYPSKAGQPHSHDLDIYALFLTRVSNIFKMNFSIPVKNLKNVMSNKTGFSNFN